MAIEIGPNLHFVERGWLNGNHFVYNGPEPALIDTAYSTGLAETLKALSDLGVEPGAVKRIILTHVHSDHVGGVKPPSRRPRAARSGSTPSPGTTSRPATAGPPGGTTTTRRPGFFATHKSLEEGDTVGLGELSFRVVHTPGHSSGMIALFEPESRILISGDALWEGDLGVMTPRIEGLDCVFRALESLDKLAALKAEVIYPGHGGPIERGGGGPGGGQDPGCATIWRSPRPRAGTRSGRSSSSPC